MSNATLREALEYLLPLIEDEWGHWGGSSPQAAGYIALLKVRAALAADDAARGTMREQFEAWAADRGISLAEHHNTSFGRLYASSHVQGWWEAWQASRAAEPQSVEPVADVYKRGYEEALNDCIRNGIPWARSMFANNADHLAPPTAPTDAEWLLTQWRDAYAAFKGAFDTPQQRFLMKDEYSVDARTRLRDFDEALCAHIATRPQAATSKETPDGRDVELRSSVHGAIPVGLHAHLPLAGGEPPSLTDRLWDSPEVMSLNAELGLTMEQLVRLARAVQPLLPAPPTKKEAGA